MRGYEGTVLQAVSGQWGWVIVRDGEELTRGGGYDSEAAAIEGLHAALAECSGDSLVGA